MIKELDFKLVKGRNETKTFKFTNDDGTNYNLTGATVALKLYLSGPLQSPTSLTGTINISAATVAFAFLSSTHTTNAGNFEYVIEETRGASVTTLIRGNVIVYIEVPFTISIDAFLRTELPANINLDENYAQQRILYWRIILQTAAGVSDANLENDASWSRMYIMLIAKLVAYDALELAAKGSLMHFLGGSYTDANSVAGGSIKKIETGPSNVEFHSLSKSVQELYQPNSAGVSAWDNLQSSLCGLAEQIGVKIPMCKGIKIVIPPRYYQNPDWDYPKLTDEGYTYDIVVSNG